LTHVTAADRQAFAFPPAQGELDGIDLGLLDPADEGSRRLLILAEHPELQRAVQEDLREIRLGGAVINPALHLTMHEIVANQLWADDPPEVWETAQRLSEAGYARHDVLHMLGSVVSDEVFEVLRHGESHDPERVRAGLAELPGSWEGLRESVPAERQQNRAERRAAERRRRGGAGPGHSGG
jgi:hypothetical protein